MNGSLRDLQVILAKRVSLLSKKLDGVADPDRAQKILDEIMEFNHRVTLVGRLLFSQQSQKLDQLVEAVRREKRKIDAAISQIDRIVEFLNASSAFLALVDDAIDFAKLL